MGAPPSRELARNRARSKRLQRFDEDERGIYILETGEPFSFTASHRDLGEQSAGLALYFDTIVHFAILMLCLLLACGVYPLVDAHQNSRLANTYEVRQTAGDASVVLTKVCERQGEAHFIRSIPFTHSRL